MPPTSAIELLPPTPQPTPPPSVQSQSTDTSFQQTLQTAQQKQSSTTDDSAQPAPTDTKPADTTATKTTAKPAKTKKPATDQDTDAADDTADASAKTDDTIETSTDAVQTPVPKLPVKKAADTDTKKPAAKTAAVSIPSATPLPVAAAAKKTAPEPGKTSDGLVERKPTVVKSTDGKNTDNDSSDTTAKQTSSNSADSAQTAQVTANPAAAVAQAPVKSVGLGTEKVAQESTDQSAKPQAVAIASAASAADAPSDPAAAAAAIADAITSADAPDANPTDGAGPAQPSPFAGNFDQQLQRALEPVTGKADATPAPTAQPQFAEANHSSIVSGIQTQLLPNGGTMQIQLNPQELGALQINVQMRNGVMTASFETSNDQASRMLSHSLNQLKSALETTGVTVEKMHVQQAPRQESQSKSGDDTQQKSQDPAQQQQARQDQQRKQMLQKMWSKLSGIEDPLDLVA